MYEPQVFVYGFDSLHRVVDYLFLRSPYITIGNMLEIANDMISISEIKKVYAIDNTKILHKEFMKMMKSKDFVDTFIFEETVAKNGLLLKEK